MDSDLFLSRFQQVPQKVVPIIIKGRQIQRDGLSVNIKAKDPQYYIFAKLYLIQRDKLRNLVELSQFEDRLVVTKETGLI